VERLLTEEEITKDIAVELTVYGCAECGFVQLAVAPPEGFYDDYEMACSFSPKFNEYLEILVATFVPMIGRTGARVLEVGCGDGTFLTHLAAAGLDVVGVEPSRRFREQARAKGHTVHALYVGAGAVPGAPFDAVVCRQVLEHVWSIDIFLDALRDVLRPGGIGLIEVPRLETAVEHLRFYDFFRDHVNYFSAATLRYACDLNGLNVTDIRAAMNREYLVAIVGRPGGEAPASPPANVTGPRLDFAALQRSVYSVSNELREFLSERLARGARTAIWGGGGKGVTILAAANVDALAYVVDSDPRKQNLYMPASHHRVYPPEHLKYDPVDTIIVTALAHREEIVATLRQGLDFSGTIVLLGRTLTVVD
jgi:SAM-dependent methyltransferase